MQEVWVGRHSALEKFTIALVTLLQASHFDGFTREDSATVNA